MASDSVLPKDAVPTVVTPDSAPDDQQRLAPLVLFTSADLTEPVQIHPCRHCEPWFVEARPHAGHIAIREWHDENCSHLRRLLADELADTD